MRRKWKQFWCNHDWTEFSGEKNLELRICEKCYKVQWAAWYEDLHLNIWQRYL